MKPAWRATLDERNRRRRAQRAAHRAELLARGLKPKLGRPPSHARRAAEALATNVLEQAKRLGWSRAATVTTLHARLSKLCAKPDTLARAVATALRRQGLQHGRGIWTAIPDFRQLALPYP